MSTEYLDNFGQDDGMHRPIDMSHICPDPDTPLNVMLHSFGGDTADPTNNHWQIAWLVSASPDRFVFRRLEIVREINVNHLTNWGPYTKFIGITSMAAASSAVLEQYTLAERRIWEEIAERMPVRVPDGVWNCQNWVMSVLQAAEGRGLLASQAINDALASIAKDEGRKSI
ncbi:hypothetical protein CPB85DRAFT_101432 [Mucidula mucida]|nr:hypothetical protein CPB85DRAFT_101432 [Mucidula mucida]